MRSRYTAFATRDADYLRWSWHPSTRPDDISIEPTQTWTGLSILRAEDGTAADDDGIVEFEASYDAIDGPAVLHEISRFVRWESRWVYLDGIRR